MSHPLLNLVEQPYLKPHLPEFYVGDTVDVQCRIVEGEKERIQTFTGVVISRKGRGLNEMFTVRRIVHDQGVERTFLLHSPNVVDVATRRRGKRRRAKLYYLRNRIGKARRLRELRITKSKAPEPELATAGV